MIPKESAEAKRLKPPPPRNADMRPAIPVKINPIPANPGNAVMRLSLSLIVLYPRFFYYKHPPFSAHSPQPFIVGCP